MLPSRLFRNTGIPPALRSLITPHGSLPSTVAVQLRFRLGMLPGSMTSSSAALRIAPLSTSIPRSNDTTTKSTTPPPVSASEESNINLVGPSSGQTEELKTTSSQPLPEKMVPKLSITFTCTVPNCGERSTHQFTKHSYEKGIVIVQCPGCKNKHLIADHLGWFKDGTEGGKLRTVEDIVKAKGEKVRRGLMSSGGDIEYAE